MGKFVRSCGRVRLRFLGIIGLVRLRFLGIIGLVRLRFFLGTLGPTVPCICRARAEFM